MNCYISEIVLNDTKKLSVAPNDIVVFVGPNNAGKSQALKDIYALCDGKSPTKVVKDIMVCKEEKSNIEAFISEHSSVKTDKYGNIYQGCGYQLRKSDIENSCRKNCYANLRSVFVAYLNTDRRLEICNPPQAINSNMAYQHPIHAVAFDPYYRNLLSDVFFKAFETKLIPHNQFGQTIPLCMGETVPPKKGCSDAQEILEDYRKTLDTYKQVQEQGDGIRSFTGILLYLISKVHHTFLIDEPESFLHPPQAKIMGQAIGELLCDNKQAFISTHSQEIIKGLLDVCPERVKIVRITRKEDTNFFSVLKNETYNEIWKDPLLKYSNIMDSLFHKQVVLCESDMDCKLYSIILSHLKAKEGMYSETLFIHCGGKHRFHKVIAALKALAVDVSAVLDIDVLNDEETIKVIYSSMGGDWDSLTKDYHVLSSNLVSGRNKIVRNDVKKEFEDIISKKTDKELSKNEIDSITALFKTETKWGLLKKGGEVIIPAGDAFSSYTMLKRQFEDKRIFLVPVGEIENFVKSVGGHGPEWVNKILEMYTDLDAKELENLRNFVGSWQL